MPKDCEGFKYKGEIILDLSVLVKFKVYENGIEKFFENEEELFFSKEMRKKYYITNFIKCSYEPENKTYRFEKNLYAFQLYQLEKNRKFSFEYRVVKYSKFVKYKEYPINTKRGI